MLSKKQRRQCLSLAENVALLSLLHRAPGPAQANQPSQSMVDDSGRILSFETEVRLTSTFAFLCGISDDPSHVIAACVEELKDRKVRVVVAINKERPASGNNVLERIKSGLEEIFRRLARANKEEHSVLEDKVLDAIVDMCKQRIFSRIRSRRQGAVYRKTGKAFLGLVIEQTLDAVRAHHKRRGVGSDAEGFIKSAVRLRDCLTRLETCQEEEVSAHIKDVLLAAHRVNRTTDFNRIFQEFSSRDLDPTTQKALELRLGKLANYLECARFLSQTAKSSRLFKGAEVKTVSLDANLFTRELAVPPECHLTACLSRCETESSTRFGPKKIISKLAELDQNDQAFVSAVRKILRESRVHAEVQIVCHYELLPKATKPRVICSSKDACYLCNLFVQLHGTFHIPGTHGNLYPGWRFLPLPTLNRVQAQLNKALEARIGEVVGNLMASKNSRLMLSLNDNESTIFPLLRSLPAKTTSVMTAEPSGSAAVLPPKPAQKGPNCEEDAWPPETPVETRPEASTKGLCDLESPGLTLPPESRPTNLESKPDNPKLPTQYETPGSRPATPGTRAESAKESPESVGEAEELALASPQDPARTVADGIHAQSGPGNETNLEQPPEVVSEQEPEPEPAPGPNSEPGARPKPENHGQEPVSSSPPGSRPTPALNGPPLIQEAPEPEVPRPSSEPGLGGQQSRPISTASSNSRSKLCPDPIPQLDPNEAQDQQAIPSQTPVPVSSSSRGSRSEIPCQLHLSRDQPLSLRLDDTTKYPPTITAGQITIFPELIRSLTEQSRSVVEVRMHWLPRRRAAAFHVARPRGFVDLESVDEGVEIDGGSSECVYVAYKGEVVVVDVTRG